MVTTVGLNSDFDVVLKNLISLDFDAAEAYEAAIERMETTEFKRQLAEFRDDHLRHTRELSAIARQKGLEPPTGPDIKMALTKGKVIFADLMGDRAILMAMKTNEDDTNTAYERAFNHKDLSPMAKETIERAFEDERRHRAWIVHALGELENKAA